MLETGVGTSQNLRFYKKEQVKKVHAVDYSPNAIEQAILKYTRGLNIEYSLQDVEKLSFKDSKFDTVVDTFGLEYYLNPHRVLTEMERVCKDGGLILILATGTTECDWMAKILRFRQPISLGKYGRFNW